MGEYRRRVRGVIWLEQLMQNWTNSNVKTEKSLRNTLRESLYEWATAALSRQGHAPAAHHRLLIRELEGLANGRWDRLMLLLPPGSAKSTYARLNVLLGTLGAMSTSVVSYWVGSSVGSARKDVRLASLIPHAQSTGKGAAASAAYAMQ